MHLLQPSFIEGFLLFIINYLTGVNPCYILKEYTTPRGFPNGHLSKSSITKNTR
jgi:hypothetical protein